MQIIIHNISKFCTASNSRDHLNVIKSAYFIESEYFIISVEIMFSLIPAEVVSFLQSSLMKFCRNFTLPLLFRVQILQRFVIAKK